MLLRPGGLSAWHAHGARIDRLFAVTGSLRIVLYDARQDSPTHRLDSASDWLVRS